MSPKKPAYLNITIGKDCIIKDDVVIGHSSKDQFIIGENALIRSGTIIYSKVKIGNGFKTGRRSLIRENSEIGDNVLIGTNAVLDGNCKLGSNITIQTGAYITAFTTVEDNVFIGPWVVTANDKYKVLGAKLMRPIIKKAARAGANSTILPGAVVGEGAVVTKDVEPGNTVVGNRAKFSGRNLKYEQ
jgi:acetyltransferase-like isoleucine patch superfamily enzyme